MFIGINRFLANWIFNVLGLVFEGLFSATLSQAQGEVYTYSFGCVNPPATFPTKLAFLGGYSGTLIIQFVQAFQAYRLLIALTKRLV